MEMAADDDEAANEQLDKFHSEYNFLVKTYEKESGRARRRQALANPSGSSPTPAPSRPEGRL
ncbi:hypothetical protein N9L68_04750 [bacterium]|nr:hypothetical protein [bacterium]